MAKINYEYYQGIDSYSDGDIEDTLMKMVEEQVSIKELSEEERSYPVLYHLSHLRENIINWYPIKSDQTVLEIGSGCGAITNALCKKAKRVVAVELSKRRALINYMRNKDKENLEIMVGNLNDIVFQEKFDYVILNGVFEYALSYTEGDKPYITFLNSCKQYVKSTGKLLIAIENRLGMKYFTGAPEDHTKNYFLGLNAYEGNQSVRTFSKTELKAILEECGLHYKFYYPYPDYKFPEEIYTDTSIKSGMYGKPYFNYDSERMEWLNEHHLTRTLAAEDAVSVFANSFLVEASEEGIFSDIEYAKMSCDRRTDRRIVTLIYKKNGRRWVVKQAAHEDAREHIEALAKSSHIDQENKKVVCLPGKLTDGNVEYKYLTEESFEKKVLRLYENHQKTEALETIKGFFDTYFGEFELQKFIPDADFQQMFGSFVCEKEYMGIAGGNLDLVLDNIYPMNDQYCVIDCEWIFDFAMPVKFIIWRSLNDFHLKHEEVQKAIAKEELFHEFDIDENDVSLFTKWNAYFAYQWLGANSTEKFAKPTKQVSMDYLVSLFKRERQLACSLYYDCGNGYSEDQKIYTEVDWVDNYFEVKFDLSRVGNIKKLRFDPVESHACKCRLESNYDFVPLNHFEKQDQWDVFLTDDPIYEAVLENSISIQMVKISGELVLTEFSQWYKSLCGYYDSRIEAYDRENHKLQANIETLQRESMYKDEQIEQVQAELQHNKNLLQLESEKVKQQEEVIQHLNEVLTSIYESKGWKLLSGVKSIVKKEK